MIDTVSNPSTDDVNNNDFFSAFATTTDDFRLHELETV